MRPSVPAGAASVKVDSVVVEVSSSLPVKFYFHQMDIWAQRANTFFLITLGISFVDL